MAVTLGPDGTPMIVDDFGAAPPMPAIPVRTPPDLGGPTQLPRSLGPSGPIRADIANPQWGAVPESPPPPPAMMPADMTSDIAQTAPPALGPVLQHHRALMQAPGNYQLAPSYEEASTDPNTGLPTAGGPQTKLGKLLSILRGAGIGAAVGSTQPTFGRGLMAANQFEQQQAQENMARQQSALTLAQARQNLAFYPYLQRLGMLKTQAEIQKSQAETGKAGAEATKATAEAGAIPTKEALEQAQAEAANYKDDPNLGLIDLRTGQPVAGGASLAPLTAEEAAELGKNAGDRVPLKLKNIASEVATRGHTTLNTDEGVYDYNRITGEKTRLGSNPRQIMMELPVPVYDKEMNGGKGGQTYATRQRIAANPDRYASTQADVQLPMIKQTVKEFASTKAGTAGGNALAFNTAIGHLGMLWDAIEALNNGRIPAFNSLAQKYAQATGSSVPTNFNTIRGAVNAEVAKVFKGGVPTDADIQKEDSNASVASSPQQLRDNVRILIGLMNSRLGALQDRYQSIMGEPNEDLINKESQGVLQKIQSGGMTPKKVGEAFMQGGQKWIADEVDKNGRPTKAHPSK